MEIIEDRVDDIPVRLIRPEHPTAGLALWMSHLGGSAAKEQPTMMRLAAAGHPVVGFDAPLHGRRSTGSDPRGFATELLAAYRMRMVPVLGRATLDALRVVTWAQERTGTASDHVVAGGVSMGGDIAVALAGIDDRVRRVACIGSTPNWRRPDMRRLDDPEQLVDQGEADRYSRWFADELDPSRHVERYVRDVGIAFECGAADRHIPARDAIDFRDALTRLDAAAGARIRITEHAGLDHFGVTTDEGAIRSALDWLG